MEENDSDSVRRAQEEATSYGQTSFNRGQGRTSC